MSNSIWATLSAIDCNDHVEKKGQFSYLAWTWAWAMVKENYPEAKYHIFEDTVYPDSTMEVRMMVEIDGLQNTMWLPVLDFKNKPIANPNAFDINSARMRCLVKCLAMFGLGHYIYAGESAPQEPPPQPLSDDEWETYLGLVANKRGIDLLKYEDEIGEAKVTEAYNKPTKGKVKWKDNVREVQDSGQDIINEYVSGFVDGLGSDDELGIQELASELAEDEWIKLRVWARLGEVEKHQIKTIIQGAEQ